MSWVSSNSASPPPRGFDPRRTTEAVGSWTGLPSARVYTGGSVDYMISSIKRIISRSTNSQEGTYVRHDELQAKIRALFWNAMADALLLYLSNLAPTWCTALIRTHTSYTMFCGSGGYRYIHLSVSTCCAETGRSFRKCFPSQTKKTLLNKWRALTHQSKCRLSLANPT